jgi:ADP-heptose:LPS heptosyltransferase
LNGKRILIHSEQGAGDLIQFSRLSKTLADRGAHVILGCPLTVHRLFRTLKGPAELVCEATDKMQFDYHCYLLSLPLILKLKLDTIPAEVPYLFADPAIVEEWRSRLAPLGNRKKIGLVWGGNPMHTNDHNRSIPLPLFAPLAEIKDAAFISIQKGEPAKQKPPAGLELIDHTTDLIDYADTAGLIANLDLVISADTSVAHLAGALGKPVWTLLPHHPDLRWLLDRPDTPWYPTMRLFRQKSAGDWGDLMQRVATALNALPPRT